jgi:putative membrane protein
MKITSWIPAFAGFFSITSSAHAQGQSQGYGMWPGMMGFGCGIGWPWPIMMFVFWIAVIVTVVFIVRRLALPANRGRGGASDESALDIIKKRYAKGEISREEYEKIKKDIS